MNPTVAGPVLSLTERSNYEGSPMLFFGLFNSELGGTMHRNVRACKLAKETRDRLSHHGHGQSLGTHRPPLLTH